jgi:WD40 repeat protein
MNATTSTISSSRLSPNDPNKPTFALSHTLLAHTAPLSVVKFSPDGKQLASSGADGIIAIWCVKLSSSRTRELEEGGEEGRGREGRPDMSESDERRWRVDRWKGEMDLDGVYQAHGPSNQLPFCWPWV